jgi:uncharacterized protein DUF547
MCDMRLRLATLALALLGLSGLAHAQTPSTAALDTVLARFVHGERVDYRGLSRDPGALRRFLASLERAAPERLSRPARIAFWANAYDARVLDGVLRRPGLASVLDSTSATAARLPAFFAERRLTAGRRISLDAIEREILRRFGDPRIHFVLNCASASCPPLPERALTATGLDSMLDAATRRFLADPSKNRWGTDGTLEVSSIFQWYAADFAAEPGGLNGFLARHWTRGRAPGPGVRLRYLPYDWSLNGTW